MTSNEEKSRYEIAPGDWWIIKEQTREYVIVYNETDDLTIRFDRHTIH